MQKQKKERNYNILQKKNGITILKTHVDANHVMLAKRFEEKMNSPLKNLL